MKFSPVFKKIVMLVIFLLLLSCDKPMLTDPDPQTLTEVSAHIALPKTALDDAGLNKVILIVTGAGMDSIRQESTISEDGYITMQLKVPAGNQRNFTATVFQDSMAVLRGSKIIDLKKNQSVELNIKLDFLKSALTIAPFDTTIAKNDTFTVYIRAFHMDSLCTIGAKLLFDHTRVQVVDFGRDDQFLKKNGGAVTQLQFTKDNDEGEVKLILGIFPATNAVNGDGAIAYIKFKALDSAVTALHLSLDNHADSDLGLYDKWANPIFAIALGSKITIN